MRLLILEDDLAIRRLLVDHLEAHGIRVTATGTVAAALSALHHTAFDVAILDLAVPDGSGLDVLRDLRQLGSLTHVIVLSGSAGVAERVGALNLGADDYVIKPFFVRELAARVLAVRRRHEIAEENGLQYGALVIDLAARQVTLHDAPVALASKEFDLLAYLAARPGHLFSRDDLLRAVWDSAADWQQASTVTEHVRRLRGKIEVDPLHPRLLQTVRGAGYRFDPASLCPPEKASSVAARCRQADAVGGLVLLDGRIVSADESAVAILGAVTEAELLGRDGLDFVAEQSQAAVRARRTAAASGQSPRSQIVMMRRVDGTEGYMEICSAATESHGRPANLTIIRPSHDTYRLRHLATGVFSEVSDAVIVTDRRFHIRSWNDAAQRLYGWAELEVIGRHLSDVVPYVDTGDVSGATVHMLQETERWHAEVQQTTRDGSRVRVSASMALINDDVGGDAFVVYVNRPAVSSGTPPHEGSELEGELRSGLDGDEFVVHYQPVVSLDDNRVISLEALVRWEHPNRGVLGPASFIPAAERTGMMVELGRVVVEKACRQTAEWRRDGHDIEIAVNLSLTQLADPGLLDDISATLDSSGSTPDVLWLEVSETALVEGVDVAADLLHRLAALGVRIAIDDFGTGWASLAYLKDLPVHALKIERSIVAGVDRNRHDTAIARSILSLADELDLAVVAEGVETVEQESALQAMGCSMGQGHFYGSPTVAAAVPMQRAHRLRRRVSSHNG